jgi:hypothetical protein
VTASQNPLASPEAMKSLVERLTRCPQVAKLSDDGHDEAWTLVHSLSDLADSSAAYLAELPALLKEGLEGDELIQRLIAIAVGELQHMLYHLEDPRFFRELLSPVRLPQAGDGTSAESVPPTAQT